MIDISKLLNANRESASKVPGQHPELLEVNKYETSKFVQKLINIIGDHPYPLDELLLMSAAFQYHLPDVVIDIGTHVGKSARVWYELSKEYNKTTIVNTIDIFDETHPEFPGYALGKYIKRTPVKQHIGDGYEVAKKIIAETPDVKFLILLDGDHEFGTVRKELELARQVKQGCLLVHDTFYQPSSNYNHGPYLAIQDFIKEYDIKQVIHLGTGLLGMSYLGLY